MKRREGVHASSIAKSGIRDLERQMQQIAQLHPVRRRTSGQGGDAVGCAARESTTCSVLLVASEIEARRRERRRESQEMSP